MGKNVFTRTAFGKIDLADLDWKIHFSTSVCPFKSRPKRFCCECRAGGFPIVKEYLKRLFFNVVFTMALGSPELVPGANIHARDSPMTREAVAATQGFFIGQVFFTRQGFFIRQVSFARQVFSSFDKWSPWAVWEKIATEKIGFWKKTILEKIGFGNRFWPTVIFCQP